MANTVTDNSDTHNNPVPIYRFSVKEVAEFCWRRGDYRFSDQNLKPTARQGQAVHQFLQKRHEQQSSHYQAEVSVSGEFVRTHINTPVSPHKGQRYQLNIRGRIDSLWQTDNSFRLEEIKTTFYHPDDLPEDQFQVHLAQARLYAALLLNSQDDIHAIDGDTPIELQVTYWQLADETSYSRTHQESKASLLKFLQATVDSFGRWLDGVDCHRRQRQQLLAELAFPFGEYRAGQKALAGACYHQAKNRDTLLIHAATGIGKSISTLFGSLKAVAENHGDQIWYLTAKTSGQQAALQAVALIQQQGSALKCLNLSNQQRACFCAPIADNDAAAPAPCQWETGFYDRKPAALEALFTENLIDLDCLQTIAREHRLCPYHLAEELLPWVDVVIGDFNYVFGLTVRNSGYLERHGRRINLLVDEAHNLPGRCRDNYSASLNIDILRSVKSRLPTTDAKSKRALNALQKAIKQTGPDISDYPEPLFNAIQQLKDQLETPDLSQGELFSMDDALMLKAELNQWLRLGRYCEPGLGEHQGQPFSLKKTKDGLTLECNNPAVVIRDLCQIFRSRVFFSGSLLPVRHFAVQLCPPETTTTGDTDSTPAKHLILESPFPRNRLRILLGNLAMGYQHRDASLPVALDYIKALYLKHPGLYLVCAPSYDVLQRLQEQITTGHWDLPTLFQSADRESAHTANQSLAAMDNGMAFVVLGGSFAEGVEWPPGVLKGVIILGNGMPGPTTQQKRLQRYYDNAFSTGNTSPQLPKPETTPGHGNTGFDHAFQFPGLNRVIQTAGRIQRTEQDAGLVLLLDQRFRQRRYQQMLPSHWQYEAVNSLEDLISASDSFWDTL